METQTECRYNPEAIRRSYLAVIEERAARERLAGWKGVATRDAKRYRKTRGGFFAAGSRTK